MDPLIKAQQSLTQFIDLYKNLSEKEKFSLGKIFQDATGGKLSPFNSPSPVCVALVPVTTHDGTIGFLGVRRAIPPFVGGVALAGGFLSPNEDPIAGTVREVLEETGIVLDPAAFESSATPKMAHNNNMLMFFRSTQMLTQADVELATANVSSTDGEASEMVIITPETELCFPLHQEAVNAAFVEYGIAPRTEVSKTFKI